MSSAFDDARQRRLDQHVAAELGISPEVLAEHPYELDENASDDGVVHNWRVLWQDTPPPGVTAHGTPGLQWSDIQQMYKEDEEDEE